MGRFTIRDEPEVDQRISADLARIERALAERLGGDLEGLVLVGGFGRGEGSAILAKGRAFPLNDYDLVVVTRSRLDPVALAPAGEALARELGIGGVDLLPVRREDLAAAGPSIFNVDLKRGGTALSGPEDLLDALPDFEPSSLPAEEASVLVLNRLPCLLESVRAEDLEGPGPPSRELAIGYAAAKVVLAAVEARLVLAGAYDTSYQERAARFTCLENMTSGRASFVQEMTDFKLRPGFPVPFDPRNAWTRARSFFLGMILDVSSHIRGEKIPDWDRWEALHLSRWFFFSRRAANRILSPRKYRDWTALARRRRAEAAEVHVLLAVQEGDAAEGKHGRRARELLGPLVPESRPFLTWEHHRRAAVVADGRHVHPHERRGETLFGP
ncbi:MAG: nucleotidyltransferase domain-containing protein [Planctomycetes bacterium]|nr:nucleotidyltransferase domain-containing protein [Planctomycetota bacterium]